MLPGSSPSLKAAQLGRFTGLDLHRLWIPEWIHLFSHGARISCPSSAVWLGKRQKHQITLSPRWWYRWRFERPTRAGDFIRGRSCGDHWWDGIVCLSPGADYIEWNRLIDWLAFVWACCLLLQISKFQRLIFFYLLFTIDFQAASSGSRLERITGRRCPPLPVHTPREIPVRFPAENPRYYFTGSQSDYGIRTAPQRVITRGTRGDDKAARSCIPTLHRCGQ